MRKKITTLGSATEDIFIKYNDADIMHHYMRPESDGSVRLPLDRKLEAVLIVKSTGGGALNAACAFSRLGNQATVISKIGTDAAADHIKKDAASFQLQTHFAIDPDLETAQSFILVDSGGHHIIFAYRGATSNFSERDIPHELITNVDCLYISSLAGESARLLPSITKMAHEAGVLVTVNPGKSQLTLGIYELMQSLPYIDIFILNAFEATVLIESLTKVNVLSGAKHFINSHGSIPPRIQEQLRHIHHMGPPMVIITDGANGVYGFEGKKIIHQPAFPTNVKSGVGAGDSFGSTFVHAILQRLDLQTSLKIGVLNSSSVLSHMDAHTGLLTFDKLLSKISHK